MKRRGRRPISLGLFRIGRSTPVWLVVVLTILILYYGRRREPPAAEILPEGVYRVARVVDGDTLLLSNRLRIRLIGADTPETVRPNYPVEAWGPEATEFAKRFVAAGEVRITLDEERTDRYGRCLAYVWVGDRMLNEELIRAGLAEAEMQFHYSEAMKARFRRAQEEARSEKRAMWSDRNAQPAGL